MENVKNTFKIKHSRVFELARAPVCFIFLIAFCFVMVSLFDSRPVFAHLAAIADAPLHIKNHDVTITVGPDATWKLTGTIEIKINTSAGRATMAAYKFPLGDELEDLRITSAQALEQTVTRTITPNLIVLRDLEELSPKATPPFRAAKAYTIPFGDLPVGTVARISYEASMKRPRIAGLFSKEFYWGLDYPELAGSITIESKDPLYFDLSKAARGTLGFAKGRLATGATVWKVTLKSPVYVKAEGEQGGILSTSLVSRLQISNQSSWKPVLDALVPKYNERATEPLPAEFEKIISSAKLLDKPDAKFNRVIDMMNQLFTYRPDWSNADGGYVPAKLSSFALTKRGDAKDFAFATSMVLRNLGYTADVAFVWKQSPTEKVWIEETPTTPTLAIFNHAVVRVNENGKLRYFDPTNSIPFGEGFLSDIGGSWALAITNAPQAFTRLPAEAPIASQVKIVQNLEMRPDASVVGSGTVHVEGPLAAELKQVYQTQGAGQIEPYLRSLFGLVLKGESANPMIRVNSQDQRGSSFDLSFSYLAPGAIITQGVYREFHLASPGLAGVPLLSAKDRATDVILSRNLTLEVETKVVGGDIADETYTSCLALTSFASLLRETKAMPGYFTVYDNVQFRADRIPAANMRTPLFQSEIGNYNACLSRVRASVGPRPAFENSPFGLTPVEVAVMKKPMPLMTLQDVKLLNDITTPQLATLVTTKIWLATRDLLRRNIRTPQVMLDYTNAILETGHLQTDQGDLYLPDHVREAAKVFGTIPPQEAKTAKFHRVHATMLYATARTNEAIVALQNAMALEPGQARDASFAAKIYMTMRNAAKTEEWLRIATTAKGSKSTHLLAIEELANFRLKNGKTNEFLALFKQAIAEAPQNAWIYHDFAKQLQNIKMWDLSIEQSRKALTILRFPEAEATLAQTLIRKAEGFYYTAPGIPTLDPAALEAAEKLALECLKYTRSEVLAYRIAGHATFLKAMTGDYGSLIATQSYFSKAVELGADDAWLRDRLTAANQALDSSRALSQVWSQVSAAKSRVPAAKAPPVRTAPAAGTRFPVK